MTDRAQPGATDSIIRNDELAQVFQQVIEGYFVDGDDPTPAAQTRADIDETALNAFALSTSSTSLTATVGPGEAFIAGWMCRDVSTSITLPSNATVRIVFGWDETAFFNETVDSDRDDADEAIIALERNVSDLSPVFPGYRLKTDSNGVTASEQLAAIGRPASGLSTGEALAFDYLDVIGT